jgi:hypothetical protein
VGNDLKITFQLSQKDVYRSNVAITIDGLGKARTIAGLVLIEALAITAVVGLALRPKPVGSHESLTLSGGIWAALFFPRSFWLCATAYLIGALNLYLATTRTCVAQLSDPFPKG